MLHIHVAFEGSWTNSFLDENYKALFKSGSSFNEGNKKLQPTRIVDTGEANTYRVEMIRRMNQANPGMTYRVPASYDNTVKGILARLLGEIRRVSSLEETHLVNQLVSKMTYRLDITSEHDEIVLLATPPNEIQGSGAGLMPAGNPLYERTEIAKKLFGHLALSFEELLEKGLDAQGSWGPLSPTDLVSRLSALDKDQENYFKAIKVSSGESAVKAIRDDFSSRIAERLKAAKIDVNLSLDKPWSVAGALLAAKVHLLTREEKDRLIKVGALSEAGNLKGLAMSGGLGGLTIKDLYDGAGCKKAISNRMPYALQMQLDAKHKASLGVIKKSGRVEIQIDLDGQSAQEVVDIIENAAVSVFHFGKKGIAYVERIYCQ